MRKRFTFLLTIDFVLLLLRACGEYNSESKGENSVASDEVKTISIMLDCYPNAVHSYLYVAEEKGYFAEEGLDVEFQFPANPTDPLTLAASGNVTMGLYYQPDVIMAKANEDIPVKAV